MATPSAVARTAPIAIAPKPSRPRQPPSRQSSLHHLDGYPGVSMNSLDSPGSDSPPNGHVQIPCDTCQLRRIKCVMGDDEDSCISCQANGAECSLADSPQPRKRKLNGDYDDGYHKNG
jgi:hypothetical protein